MQSQDNDYTREFLPSFGIGQPQAPLCVLHVFAIGGSGRDCAVYRGIVPTSKSADYVQQVRKGGNKISETEARKYFELGDLQYRH